MAVKPAVLTYMLLPVCLLTSLAAGMAQPNSLDWTSFRLEVLNNHPVARQAAGSLALADAGLLRAKGGFDPKLYGDYRGKRFQGKNYFSYTQMGIKIPLGLGLQLESGYYRAGGEYLNTESRLPNEGQASAGFSWTLGQGLLIDQRRADVRQARIGLRAAEAERLATLNDLLLDAAKAYWTWAAAAAQLVYTRESAERAMVRHEAMVESFRQGEKPAIDTLETFIQVQNRRLDANFLQTDVQAAALTVAGFRWTNASSPAPLPPESLPPPPDLLALPRVTARAYAADSLVELARTRFPKIQSYYLKRQDLEVEARLKKEKRKPVVDVSYYLLGKGAQFFPAAYDSGDDLLGSVKWSVDVAYPLLNRKARGDWQMTTIKIDQNDRAIEQKIRELEVKTRQALFERNNLAGQTALYYSIVDDYRRLFTAEEEKFRQGESSVFLLNSREQRWLEAQIKYVKLLSEYFKAEATLKWATGSLEL